MALPDYPRHRAKMPAASRSGNHQFGEAGQRIVQVIGEKGGNWPCWRTTSGTADQS